MTAQTGSTSKNLEMLFQTLLHPFFKNDFTLQSLQIYMLIVFVGLFRDHCKHPAEDYKRFCLAQRMLFSQQPVCSSSWVVPVLLQAVSRLVLLGVRRLSSLTWSLPSKLINFIKLFLGLYSPKSTAPILVCEKHSSDLMLLSGLDNASGTPEVVWYGEQNWTLWGLCQRCGLGECKHIFCLFLLIGFASTQNYYIYLATLLLLIPLMCISVCSYFMLRILGAITSIHLC